MVKNISNERATRHVRRCHLVYRFLYLLSCPLVEHGNGAIQSGKSESLLDFTVVVLFR